MAWPKGKPRKGYIKATSTREPTRGTRGRKPKFENDWIKPEWKSLLVHKNGPWTSLCPACEFPEADGGYCPACGWTTPIHPLPHNTAKGRSWQ
jgi:hypothetical protein